MTKVIELKGVTFKNKDSEVLREVSFLLEEGKFSAFECEHEKFVLDLLAGKLIPDSGKVLILEHDPSSLNFRHKADLFYIHEGYEAEFPKTLLETLKYYRFIYPRWSNHNFNKMLKDRKFSVKKNYKDLSDSQKIEFLLMMALAARPKIIMLGDVARILSRDAEKYFLPLLKKFTEFGGTIISSGSFSEYADEIIKIKEAKIVLEFREYSSEKLVA